MDAGLQSIIEACAKLPAHQLDALIQAIGLIRLDAKPSVPMAPDDLVPVTDAPALVAGVRSDGRLEISIRSPAYGWQKFTLSNHNTAAIGEHLILTKPFWEQEQQLSIHKGTRPVM